MHAQNKHPQREKHQKYAGTRSPVQFTFCLLSLGLELLEKTIQKQPAAQACQRIDTLWMCSHCAEPGEQVQI